MTKAPVVGQTTGKPPRRVPISPHRSGVIITSSGRPSDAPHDYTSL